MNKAVPLLLGALLTCSAASGSPVSWGSYSLLFSTERESGSAYSLKADGVSGRLNIRRDVTYSLSFQAGRINVGGKTLKAGCSAGHLKKGASLLFQGARRVELHIPSQGCPRR